MGLHRKILYSCESEKKEAERRSLEVSLLPVCIYERVSFAKSSSSRRWSNVTCAEKMWAGRYMYYTRTWDTIAVNCMHCLSVMKNVVWYTEKKKKKKKILAACEVFAAYSRRARYSPSCINDFAICCRLYRCAIAICVRVHTAELFPAARSLRKFLASEYLNLLRVDKRKKKIKNISLMLYTLSVGVYRH